MRARTSGWISLRYFITGTIHEWSLVRTWWRRPKNFRSETGQHSVPGILLASVVAIRVTPSFISVWQAGFILLRSIATEDGFVVKFPGHDAPPDSRNPDRP